MSLNPKVVLLFSVFFQFQYVSQGFVFDDGSSQLDPDTSDDVKYLHLLLADEKNERLRQQTEIDQLRENQQTIQEQIELLTNTGSSVSTPNVAFRTQLMHEVGQVPKGFVVIFDKVNLNLGNAYDVRHGIFRAPYNGTYQFAMSLGNSPGNHVGHLYLKKNNETLEFAWAGYSTGWEMAGVSTVAELHVGDDVWIEGEGYIGGGFSNHLHTSFSGFLIHNFV